MSESFPVYFHRQLKLRDPSTLEDRVEDEEGVIALAGNKVILGEPGMGKTEMMREIGRKLGTEPITAIRLINHKNPARLISAGKPLLIDGLDEAIARREGDAVDAVLAQLEELDSPPFILACRSREWQERTVSNLRQVYGAEPHIFTLEPFDRGGAYAFLAANHPSVDSDRVLDHLASHNLADLYRNPLTLTLLGRVAETDIELPASRAALFERVCHLVWPEHDLDRQHEGLAQLGEEDALNAAGAIAAGLLLASAEAVSAAGAAQAQEGDIRLVEFEALPGAGAARAIFSSKLFQSVGSSRAKPIHRVIAEYLGARWLAHQAETPRVQRRVLTQFHGAGSVPASLRGLHAWLAYHSPVMAEKVISKDPYGVLRYGEPAALTPALAICLFNALCELAKDDPYFRSADWDSKTAGALMIPALKYEIDEVIGSAKSNEHLRSLLIEGLEGNALASELADTLEKIVLSPERFYRERDDAALALLPHRDQTWWQTTIATLTAEGGEDAPRLALELIRHIDADVSDELLVETLFADLGVGASRELSRRTRRIRVVHFNDPLIASVHKARLAGILDLIADRVSQIPDRSLRHARDVAEIVATFILRAINEGMVSSTHASSLWRWLGVFEKASWYGRKAPQALAERLATEHDVRRAVQKYVLTNERSQRGLLATEICLRRRFVALKSHPEDIVDALERLADDDNRISDLRQDWKDLVRLGMAPEGLDLEVRGAAEKFRRGDKPLAAFLQKLETPKKPGWEIRKEKRARKRERKRKAAFETARRDFAEIREDIRLGKLGAVFAPAQAYLDHFHDLSSELSPGERLAAWLGPELRDEAITGFEAVLHRSDLPTPSEIAGGFAEGTIFDYGFPIMVGLYERLRKGVGIGDLSVPLKQSALLLSYDDHGWNLDSDKEALRAALEAEAIPTAEARLEFARLWIEPALAAGNEHVNGLYRLAHDPQWRTTGAALSADWLMNFPNVPEPVEAMLVDCLTYGDALDALRHVAEARAETAGRNFNHMLLWLAIDVLVRFDAVRSSLDSIGANHPEFIWFLRNRFERERDREMLPLTAAQTEWVITEFRQQWPYAELRGSGSGDSNDYDATRFLRSLINHIANDTSVAATEAMARLVAGPNDTYSTLIRHMAAEQRQKRAEENYSALRPVELAALLNDGAPSNIEDLIALVREEMTVAQRKLIGDDLDSAQWFWTDDGKPRNENRCRDRLAAMVGPELACYGIQRITEADMPQNKRADLAFARGQMQVPIEVKGQWHPEVWDAATGQLDAQYLIDWRSEQHGIYCVLWFGDLPSNTNRRLKVHPEGLPRPESAERMRSMLVDRVPGARRMLIDVLVLDLSAGRE